MKKTVFAATAAIALMAGAPMVSAATVDLGLLDCEVSAGEGFIFGSTKSIACTYTPSDSSLPSETYSGEIKRYGIDIGFTEKADMKWAVLAKTAGAYGPGALAGHYGGVGAEVTAALGVGTNVLVRDSTSDFILQPVSVQGQTGLNIALGVAELELSAGQ